MYVDFLGVGPKNFYVYNISPTKDGGVTYRDIPNGRWAITTNYKKTRYGYKGTTNAAGGAVPFGGTEMRRVR